MKYRFLIIGVVSTFCVFQLVTMSAKDNATEPNSKNSNNSRHTSQYWHKLADKSHRVFSKFYTPANVTTNVFGKYNKYNSKLTGQKSNDTAKKISGSNPVIAAYDRSQNSAYNEISANQPSADKSTYIYISEVMANDIMRCKLAQTGVSDCKVVLNKLMGPQNMVIIDNNFYLVNYNQPILFSCGLTSNGDVESCNQTPIPITTKAVNMIYSSYSLYITDMDLKETVQCSLDYNFLVQNCVRVPPIVSPSLVNTPYQLYNTASYLGYTYVTLYDAKYVYTANKCVESTCSILHDPNLSGPNTIKILNNTAYLTDGITNNLVSCAIGANGSFAPCLVLKSGLQIPVAIAFYSPS